MGSLSTVTSNGIFGGPGSIEQAYPLTSGSSLPERPGEQECRYFMNTGNCKYGSDCKYHHPKEKFAQMAATSLGPHALPLRPGQAVCSYYSLYGICKFGPTCKYDHPMMGYSYNYGMSLPSMSMPIIDPSGFLYGGTHYSSVSSPSKSLRNGDGTKTPGGSPSCSPSPEHGASPSHSE